MSETMGASIKRMNRAKIYRLIYETPEGVSKQEIMHRLGLSLPTVTQNLEELQQDGLVKDSGAAESTGGRRARSFSIVKDARTAVGIDISREHFTAVLVDLSGEVICREKQEISFSRTSAYYQEIGRAVSHIVSIAHADPQKVLGVGLGVPGLVTQDQKKVFYGKILDFEGFTSSEIASYLPFPCMFYNDAKAAGFAELWNRSDLSDAFYILLSDHVGGAMIRHHQVDLGDHTCAGEIGHMTVVPFGRQCYCGKSGCVETYCSADVLSGGSQEQLAEFFRLLRQGDSEKREAWEQYVSFLSLAVSNVLMLLDCPIILGGYVGAYLEEFIDEVRLHVKKRNPFSHDTTYLTACRYKVEAIAAGAALPFIDQFLRGI